MFANLKNRSSNTLIGLNKMNKWNKFNKMEYFFYTGLVLSGVLLNNYEKIFYFFNIQNCWLKKKIDKIFNTDVPETDIQLIINQEILGLENMSTKSPEDIVQINLNKSKSNTESIQSNISDINIDEVNFSEKILFEEVKVFFEQMKVEIFQMEIDLSNKFKERVLILQEIKKELENQREILNTIHSKLNKSNINEKNQWEELKLDIDNSLNIIYFDLDQLENMSEDNQFTVKNLKEKIDLGKVTKDKELEIMRSFMANYNYDILDSHYKIEKLQSTYESLTLGIRNKLIEISNSEELIKDIRNIEMKYLIKKSTIIEKLINEEPISEDNKTVLNYNPELLYNNEKNMILVIQYLLDSIQKSNNHNNLYLFNKTINFFYKKMFEISYLFKDQFVIDILSCSKGNKNNKRLYSQVEIENEFQLVKRNVLFTIFLEEYGSNYKIINNLTQCLCKGTELFLRIMGILNISNIKEKDSSLKKKLKALYFLRNYISIGNYPEAFKMLNYLKTDLQSPVVVGLNQKLGNMTNEILLLDLIKNHLI